ncbi:hypothetical protein LB507_010994, partial [Fusarium sp. FIESC RH6]
KDGNLILSFTHQSFEFICNERNTFDSIIRPAGAFWPWACGPMQAKHHIHSSRRAIFHSGGNINICSGNDFSFYRSLNNYRRKLSLSSIATTTSDALLSSSTELSSEATDTSVTATWTTELSTTSYTVEPTTSDIPISTTTEKPAPSNLLLNPSFDEPNPNGQFDGSPWAVDFVTAGSLNINQNLGRTGSRSAYWSFPATNELAVGIMQQRVLFESNHVYKFSYWWYIDESVQPQGSEDCQIYTSQQDVNGRITYYSDTVALSWPLPLKTWTKREFQFNAESLSAAYMQFTAGCFTSTGTGLKIAIDDVQLFY